MDQLKQKKAEEARKHIADAEKSLKTSLFKRKPDYDSAASAYNLAATCYKISKDLENSIECYRKSAEAYHSNNSLYHAAKQYEQIAFLANENKDYQLTYESIEKAADLMLTDGTRDSAGIIIEKTANMLKVNAPEKALKLYKKVIYLSEVEDKTHEQVVFHEQAIGLALKLEQYSEAIGLIDDMLKVLDNVGTVEQITKYVLTYVIIQLNKDDWVTAKNYLESAQNKYDAKFSRVEELVTAYDEKEDEKLKALIKNYLSYAVDNEALKIMNKIVKSDEWIKQCKEVDQDSNVRNPNSSVPATIQSTDNPPLQAAEESDDEIDLK